MIVTFRHALTVPYFTTGHGFCRPKMRAWFDRHGLDYAAFKRDGIDEQVLLDTGDGFAIACVRWAHECEGEAHGR